MHRIASQESTASSPLGEDTSATTNSLLRKISESASLLRDRTAKVHEVSGATKDAIKKDVLPKLDSQLDMQISSERRLGKILQLARNMYDRQVEMHYPLLENIADDSQQHSEQLDRQHQIMTEMQAQMEATQTHVSEMKAALIETNRQLAKLHLDMKKLRHRSKGGLSAVDLADLFDRPCGLVAHGALAKAPEELVTQVSIRRASI